MPVTSESYCAADQSETRVQEGLEGQADGSIFL